MTSLFNVIWFIFGGEVLALVWLVLSGLCYITIIGAPIGRSCLEFAKLSAAPFGKEIIREKELSESSPFSGVKKAVNFILNLIWFFIGVFLSLAHLVVGLASCVTIVGIPAGIVHIRMGKFILFPVGARVVSKKKAYAIAAANEIKKRK